MTDDMMRVEMVERGNRTYAIETLKSGGLLVRTVGGSCQLAIETPDRDHVRLTALPYPGEENVGDLSITLDIDLLRDFIDRARSTTDLR